MTWFGIICAVVGITGTVLNIRKHRACFALWAVSNSAWLTYGLISLQWGLAAQNAVYLALSIWGLVAWRRCQ